MHKQFWRLRATQKLLSLICVSVGILFAPVVTVRAILTTPVPSTEIAIAHVYVADFLHGNTAGMHPLMDNTMKRGLTPDLAKSGLAALNVKYGKFVKQGATRTSQLISSHLVEFNIVYIACQFAKGPIDAKVVFDPSHKIGGFFFVRHGMQ